MNGGLDISFLDPGKQRSPKSLWHHPKLSFAPVQPQCAPVQDRAPRNRGGTEGGVYDICVASACAHSRHTDDTHVFPQTTLFVLSNSMLVASRDLLFLAFSENGKENHRKSESS